MAKKRHRLSKRQRLFVEYYIETGNAREAATRAGYSPTYGSRLVRNLNEEIAARTAQEGIEAGEVIRRMVDIAKGDMGDFLSADPKTGKVKVDLAKARKLGKTHLIRRLRRTQFGWSITLYDAQQALESLARLLGLYEDKMTISLADVEKLAARVVEVIDVEIDDPDKRERIFTALGFLEPPERES